MDWIKRLLPLALHLFLFLVFLCSVANSLPLNFESILEQAEAGDPEAQYAVGEMYALGVFVPQDINGAIKWFKLASGQGHPDAQFQLAVAYEGGDHLPLDIAEAHRLYLLAAEQGHMGAQCNLGTLYYYGSWAVEQNINEAIKWWKLSATQGSEIAQFTLGEIYLDGAGVKSDFTSDVRLRSPRIRIRHKNGDRSLSLHRRDNRQTGRDSISDHHHSNSTPTPTLTLPHF